MTVTRTFASIADDLRLFLQGIEFAHLRWGWLFLCVFIVLILLRFAVGMRTRRLMRRATAHAGISAQLFRPAPRRRALPLASLGVVCLLFGLLGPHWGRGDDDGYALGRDFVLVLDLSRSMNAEDTQGPSRALAAIRTATDFANGLRSRGGGHRLGIVVFAARAVVLVPLTTDTDHILATLAELDPAYPPPDIRATDQSRSGTRIGQGLLQALAACDDRFPQAQSILLFSDGDDPVEDGEALTAVDPARAAGIPVHAIGFGDPDRDSTLTVRGQLLEFTDEQGIADPVRTRLHEDSLRRIALETRGSYLPARREQPAMEPLLRDLFASTLNRETSDDAVPRSRDRSGLFFGIAALFLLAAIALRR